MGLLVSNCDTPCQCGGTPPTQCVPATTSGPADGDGCQTTWNNAISPNSNLQNPSVCAVKFNLVAQDAFGAPGFGVEELYGRNLGAFNWTYSVSYDGSVVLTDSGGVNVPFSSSASIQFHTAKGWFKNSNNNWEWDYDGPASGNLRPVVAQTFTLSQQRCLYKPSLPAPAIFHF